MGQRTFSSESVTVTEICLTDAELPAATAESPSLLMHVSAPTTVELCLEGRYQPKFLRPGDFCIAPPGPIPAARWQGERSLMIAALAPWLLQSVAEAHDLGAIELPRCTGVEDPQITHLMFALHAAVQDRTPDGRPDVEAISRALAIRLLTAYAVTPRTSAIRGGLSRPALRRVLEFIDSNLDQSLTLKDLAQLSGLSVDHFARAFRESTGAPPHRYLVGRRLNHARQLLERTDRPIADIAQTLGFTDQSHLTNLFRRYFGATPARARAASEYEAVDHIGNVQ
jgi:AraC family transcriptional regulator